LITMLRTAFPDLHFVCFRDGKAIEHWGLRDEVGMMRQMGLMPEPGRSKEASPT
jgi:predicted ester cyclase